MRVLEHLEPARVFWYFEEICGIPHGSHNTKAISDYCVAFAKAHGLEYHQDAANNVIIIKEASAGYEASEPLILQGHIDMVCEKTPECPIDMEKEGLQVAVDGDQVYAKGTTLGGDDGIAVAMILALLESDSVGHPRLEAVLTSDEETGMLGAAALDVAPLKGRKLLNLDSEEEGIFTVSCSGGVVARCDLPVERETADGTVYTVTVSGLKGGHSGMEIDKGLGMGNELLGRILCALSRRTEIRLVSVAGGSKDNAIVRESSARFLCADQKTVEETVEELRAAFTHELAASDPGVTVTLSHENQTGVQAMTKASTEGIVLYLSLSPSGIQAMSQEIPGLVQSSLNLGILQTEDSQVTAAYCVRSSVDSQKQMMLDRLACLAGQIGGTLHCSGDYPAWEFRKDSALREVMEAVFVEQYGHAPKVSAIHAGLECGLLSGKIADLDCVSVGPDLEKVHTAQERMSISSVQRVWKFLVSVVERCK